MTEQLRPDVDRAELEGKMVHLEKGHGRNSGGTIETEGEMFLVVDDDIELGGGGIEMRRSVSINDRDDSWQIDAPSSSSGGNGIQMTDISVLKA